MTRCKKQVTLSDSSQVIRSNGADQYINLNNSILRRISSERTLSVE